MAAEGLKRVHAALRCGTAALTPRQRVTVNSPPFEMADMVESQAGGGKPTRHHLVFEAKANVRVALAQLFALVRGEIDDQQRSAGRKYPRCLGDRGGRRVRIMQHLVDDDAVGAVVGKRKRIHVALAEARLDPAASSFTRARRSISEERSMPIAWLARGPNSSIIRPVPVPMSTSRPSGRLPRPSSIARSTSLSATWSERIWSHTSAWPVK